ncbi:hypothetical protein ACRRTK_008468 [Alexandromys fortis]
MIYLSAMFKDTMFLFCQLLSLCSEGCGIFTFRIFPLLSQSEGVSSSVDKVDTSQ